jgi:predicted GH43/DUF377 family glycosyl hydrolase
VREKHSLNDWELKPFEKFDHNPILTPSGDTWQSKDVFNPAAWTDGEKIWLLYRAEDSTGVGVWNGTSRIGLASSRDGYRFVSEAHPVLEPTEAWEQPGGCEDPRVVRIGEIFYLTYTAYDGRTARLAMAISRDLHSWEKHGLALPDLGWTKSGALLSTPVEGRYWMYFGDTNIWAAHSNNLHDWTVMEKPVLQPRKDHFDSLLVEPGPPPLITKDGILLLYNGADSGSRYACGQALFDKNDPTKIMQRSEGPFLSPSHAIEFSGQVPNVVFIEGLVAFQNRWFLYYGMGDSGIGVAVHTPV